MKIVLFTATGAENLGDELITLCEIREFLKEKDIQITLFSHSVERTKRFLLSQKCPLENITILEYFPNALRKQPLKNIGFFGQTLRAIKEADTLYIGGGGLLYGKKEEGHSPLKLWSLRVLLAKMFSKKIIYLSLGITCEKEEIQSFSRSLFKGATITVRDSRSQEILRELGYSTNTLPDPVWNYDISDTQQQDNKKTIGISLRKGFLPDALVTEIVKKLQNEGYEIIFLPHSLHPESEMAHDGYYVQNFLFPGVKTAQSIEQTLEYYKTCHIVISMRLHSMILASIHAKPFIGISYGTKTLSLLSEIEWTHSLGSSEVTVENICAHMNDIESHYTENQDRLREVAVKMKKTYMDSSSGLLGK